MPRIIIDFLWISILLSILLGLLASVIPALGQSGSIVSTAVAALGAGLFYRRRTGAEASKPFAWKVSLAITVVVLLLSAAVVSLLRKAGDLPELGQISILSYVLGVSVLGLVILLVVRFFFRWGTTLGGKTT